MNNKKSVIALLLIAIIGIVGLTIAYFANSTDVENTFTTKEYGTTYTESFVSPENWLPGDTTTKTLVANNTGEVDQAVRIHVTEAWATHNNGTLNGWIHADGTKSNHTTETELANDERVAILNLANASDWTKVGDYYYYNYKLAPGESTTSFLESVTFNSKTKLDDTCTTTTNNGVKTVTCNSSGDDYDNATYTLTLTIETVQYNKYASAWSTGNTVNILEERPVPGAQYLLSNATNASDAEFNASTKSNMFVFSHPSTAQTPALTDYRYIGDNPNNYVKFNCDNDGTNCEIWRILGVFSVDDGTGNYEQRIKLVRGSAFENRMAWDDDSDENESNDWTIASLKNFLNEEGDYYERRGTASEYGLKISARNMIDDAVFYLGVNNTNSGSVEEVYAWERGSIICSACNLDVTKLTWTGEVALMYPSDEYMVYGKGVDNNCYNDVAQCATSYPWGSTPSNPGQPTKGWIFNSNILENQSSPDYTWLLSPSSRIDLNASYYVLDAGCLISHNSDNTNAVRPVVYLKSNIKIAGGTGEVGSEYTLEAM